MVYDSGLVDRTRDALRGLGERGIREKNIFSGWGFIAGKSAFVIAWRDGLIVKCPPDEYDAALATRGVTPFAPGGERPMGTWVVVSDETVAEDPELSTWIARGLRGVRSPTAVSRTARTAGRATAAKRAPSAKKVKTSNAAVKKLKAAKKMKGAKKVKRAAQQSRRTAATGPSKRMAPPTT